MCIRAAGVQFLRDNPERFIESNTKNSWLLYLNNMSIQGTWADEIIIQTVAVSCSLSVEVVLFSSKKSGIVIRFDNHMMSRHGGHFKIREFSYSLRFVRHLFDYTRVIYL